MTNKILLLLIALLGLLAGVGAARFYAHRSPAIAVGGEMPNEPIIGKPRPALNLLDLRGKSHDISEWNGKVILVNFWASWCPPCVKEMPALMKLREAYQARGFEIIGVALDSKDAVSAFIDPLGIDYPILMAEQEGIALAQQYGDRLGALPYTVIVDRQGVVRHIVISELSYEKGESLIKPLL
ncbi:MAG: TlpA family protein disulfide reductase [Gammaproteobacteria bacterium]|nr:TlpA family protein disulfide reductase [Gammaproteobacteria bacterium]